MRLDNVTLSILNHILKSDEIDISKFTDMEKQKLDVILKDAEFTIETFSSRKEFSQQEEGNIIYSLLKLGIQNSKIFEMINWKGFEYIISSIFDENEYSVITNFRFKDEFAKYEIDVLAYKFPYLFVIDCKRHKSGFGSFLKISADKQKDRLKYLVESFPIISEELIRKLTIPQNQRLMLFPIIISWRSYSLQFHQGVPIVPYNFLSGFLQEIDEYRENIFSISLMVN